MLSPLFRKRSLSSESAHGIETGIWDFMSLPIDKHLTTRTVQEHLHTQGSRKMSRLVLLLILKIKPPNYNLLFFGLLMK